MFFDFGISLNLLLRLIPSTAIWSVYSINISIIVLILKDRIAKILIPMSINRQLHCTPNLEVDQVACPQF